MSERCTLGDRHAQQPNPALLADITLIDHERRISVLERVDAYMLRIVGVLVLLKFMGVDNLWQIVSFVRGVPHS